MRQLYYLLIPLLLFSCTRTHYLYTVDKPTALYQNEDTTHIIGYIPPGKQLIAHKKGKRYTSVTFGNKEGYIVTQSFPTEVTYAEKELRYLHFNSDSTYTYIKSSSSGSAGGTVYVKGYYRKDGTYVKPHTRKAPKT